MAGLGQQVRLSSIRDYSTMPRDASCQGCELWQLSLVDPDNRRSVDYALGQQALDAMRAVAGRDTLMALAADLLQHIGDGRISTAR